MARSLGEIIGKFAELEAHEVIAHCDVDAYYAPSECHGDVASSFDNKIATLEKQLGITRDKVFEEGEKRTSPNTMQRYFGYCVSRILYRDNPFCEERKHKEYH